ncbi:tyrosine-type recombinase/integrase [Sinorhizobium meliloti]|uniref:tyrosine-type recombinase/integrase n=1 Tax=Rhizobium meliloti TaxID=382 RepID=UPI000FDBEC1A|nr:integrase [Sinorhizobium meliloti]MDW9936590.1 tyrosine-type recombinase/integrase [Sinorhizobium meliloti]MDX0395833.1 tyrosine-type recombinase/integrase [Sinorhizobium meliloti]MQX33281.1 tyrosine-type recombinase/integrase [Sinorhizobium meliloti]RVH68893.1 integrase [Sinorhizobium meliloti]RVO60612.1 integrase [Sinorhizobium meliloti]
MPRLTEARALREPLPKTDKPTILRCSEIRGFIAVIRKSGKRTWGVETTTDRITKRTMLGDVGVLAFEGPPEEPGARDLAVAAINGNRQGKDAREVVGKKKQPKGLTLNEVWDEYEKAGYPVLRGTGRKSETTIKHDKNRWTKHIEPTLGKKAVSEIDEAAFQRWLDGIKSDGQRSHCLTLAKSIIKFAKSRGLAETHDIEAKAEKSKELQNFYSQTELLVLDKAAQALIVDSPHRLIVISAVRLLLQSGMRTGEVLALRWSDIVRSRHVIKLPRDKAHKTGREVELTPGMIAIIDGLPRINDWVFPSPDSKNGHLTTIQKAWRDVCKRAGLQRHRPHDMRHSWASSAINSGVSLFVTGQILGHKQATTTQRYAHLEKEAKRAAAMKVAAVFGQALTVVEGGKGSNGVKRKAKKI